MAKVADILALPVESILPFQWDCMQATRCHKVPLCSCCAPVMLTLWYGNAGFPYCWSDLGKDLSVNQQIAMVLKLDRCLLLTLCCTYFCSAKYQHDSKFLCKSREPLCTCSGVGKGSSGGVLSYQTEWCVDARAISSTGVRGWCHMQPEFCCALKACCCNVPLLDQSLQQPAAKQRRLSRGCP